MKNLNNLWLEVDKDLKENSTSGYKMALLDSDKILRIVIKSKGYGGGNPVKKLSLFGIHLEKKEDLKRALEKKEEILESEEYTLSSFEVEDYVKAYKEAVGKILEKKDRSFFKKTQLLLAKSKVKDLLIKKILIPIILFVLSLKFLTSTEIGREFSREAVKVNDQIFDTLIFILFAGIIIILLIVGIFSFFERRRNIKIIED